MTNKQNIKSKAHHFSDTDWFVYLAGSIVHSFVSAELLSNALFAFHADIIPAVTD